MKWDSGITEARLIADDGEILDEVKMSYHTGAFVVQSTHKSYVTMEQAKSAAEKRAQGGFHV